MKIIYRDPNVTVFQSALFQTNSTVVVTDDMVLVVDPAWLPDEVLAIRNYVDAQRKGRPIWLLFTHSDYDHIIGYGAFLDAGVICSRQLIQNPKKEAILEQILQFDEANYIQRDYPIVYPEKADFEVFRDGTNFKLGSTRMTFYLASGHTNDGVFCVVWQLGLCFAGDYLCNVEFPFIYFSSVEYEKTLQKISKIHDKTWFVRLIPGHGDLAMTIQEWLNRRNDGLAYIHELHESVRLKKPFDEEKLWEKFHFKRLQKKYHDNNLKLVQREFEELGKEMFAHKRGAASPPETAE